jgi:hypothetical protein
MLHPNQVGRANNHFDGNRSVYHGYLTDAPASMPKVSWNPRRPKGVTITAWLRVILSIQPRSKKRLVIAPPSTPAMCGRFSVQSRQRRQRWRRVESSVGSRIPNLVKKRASGAVISAAFLIEHDVFAGDESVGDEIDAEAARKVVEANPCRIERVRLPC